MDAPATIPQRLVFSPDAIVRARDGRILIHTAGSALPAFQTDQPTLVGWLCRFFQPTAVAVALAGMAPPARAAVMPALDYLLRCGALCDADAANGTADVDDDAREHARARRHLPTLARSVYDLAADVLAFGPWGERELRERTGAGVERRLMALLAHVDALRGTLAALRPRYLDAQQARLPARRPGEALKLHVGCGDIHLDGWVNLDIHPAPLAINLLWGLPFEDSSARCIYLSHVLEHLYYPGDVHAFLAEARRCLVPGGWIRIVVPDIARCIDAYVRDDRAFFDGRRENWPGWRENPTRLADFLSYAGAGTDPGYLFESHKYGYDAETLQRVLRDAGFVDIHPSAFMASGCPELNLDAHSATAAAEYAGRHYSLFMDARAPG